MPDKSTPIRTAEGRGWSVFVGVVVSWAIIAFLVAVVFAIYSACNNAYGTTILMPPPPASPKPTAKVPAPLPPPLPATKPHDPTPPGVQVMVASARYGVPEAVLLAVWERECNRRARCAPGAAGELTAFQIKPIAAQDAGCARNWTRTVGAYCAARYLDKLRDYCGPDLARRLSYYNGWGCADRSPYSAWVLRRAAQLAPVHIAFRGRL